MKLETYDVSDTIRWERQERYCDNVKRTNRNKIALIALEKKPIVAKISRKNKLFNEKALI